MNTIYRITIEYSSNKDKFDLEPELDKELSKLLEKLKPLNIKTKITKDTYEESN